MAVHMDPALGNTTTSMLKPYIPQYPVSIGHGSAAVYKDKDKGIMMMCGSSKDDNPTFCYDLRIGRGDRARMTMTSYATGICRRYSLDPLAGSGTLGWAPYVSRDNDLGYQTRAAVDRRWKSQRHESRGKHHPVQ